MSVCGAGRPVPMSPEGGPGPAAEISGVCASQLTHPGGRKGWFSVLGGKAERQGPNGALTLRSLNAFSVLGKEQPIASPA